MRDVMYNLGYSMPNQELREVKSYIMALGVQ